MASIGEKHGRRFVQFQRADGARKTVSLGRIPKSTAEVIRGHVEHLITSSVTAQPIRRQTAQWLEDIGQKLHRKLVRSGLIPARDGIGADSAILLGDFLHGYIDGRTDLKPQTRVTLRQVRRWLVKFFGADRDLRTITRGEMGDWHRLIKSELAPATVSAHVKKARQMFLDAVDRKLIAENPLKKLKAGTQANPDRLQYVPVSDVLKVIDKCPDSEWKLIFALARFAGLRTPSETSSLRWADISWDEGRMIVRSPKTEHHQGHDKRQVPIVPELLPFLRDAQELAPEGAVHVIVRHRGENLRTTAQKIVARAGLERWPRLFQNLRSSCETDLTTRFPVHVACAWIGNSQAVAAKHYLTVTDQHFDTAAGKSAALGAAPGPSAGLTETKLTNEELRKIVHLFNTMMTPAGFAHPRNLAGILAIGHERLTRALRSLKNQQRQMRSRDVARLTRAVRAARSGRGK